MKHRNIAAAAGALALAAALAGGALALSGGDSLISLSYLKNTFLPSAQTQLEQEATRPLQDAYDQAVAKLEGEESGTLYSETLDSRTFTLRLFDTCLESGSAARNEGLVELGYPSDLYPYSFPAGSLGRDSHFLQDVTIAEDGEDVVVTALLTDRAWRFTVETSNLGFDNIPSFRIVFREKNPNIDGWD